MSQQIPVVEILTKHRRPFLTAIGLKISEIAYFSIASVFVISYATGHLGLPRSVILQSVQMSAAVALIAIPTFGWLADNLGRKTMFIASCLFSIAFAFPMFWLLDTKDSTIITLTVVAAISFGQWSALVSAPLGIRNSSPPGCATAEPRSASRSERPSAAA